MCLSIKDIRKCKEILEKNSKCPKCGRKKEYFIDVYTHTVIGCCRECNINFGKDNR